MTRILSASTPSSRPRSSISRYARPLARVDGMDGLCYRLQEIICYTFFVAQRFIDHLRRFAAFCGVLRRFAAFCGILRHFAAFCSVLRRVGDKFLLQDQIFGGAQTPVPFSGRLKIIVPKWGGSGPLSPLKTCFQVSSRKTTSNDLACHFLVHFSWFLFPSLWYIHHTLSNKA